MVLSDRAPRFPPTGGRAGLFAVSLINDARDAGLRYVGSGYLPADRVFRASVACGLDYFALLLVIRRSDRFPRIQQEQLLSSINWAIITGRG